jgi:hypothetical protein
MVRIHVDARGLKRVGLLGVSPLPGTPIRRQFLTPSVGLASGESGSVQRTRSDVVSAYSSQLRINAEKNRAVIDWFRLLFDCVEQATVVGRGQNHAVLA